MSVRCEIAVTPAQLHDTDVIRGKFLRKARIAPANLQSIQVVRRSLDSRKRPIYRLQVEGYLIDEEIPIGSSISDLFRQVEQCPAVHIIGAGPAGYFAALQCLEAGLKPIVLDRGKDVRSRRRDLKAIQQDGVVDPHSNYCFGEGGAGTYSDGKLYTRSKKRGDVVKVLQLLVEHGAQPEILVDAHPHIGTNKLPRVISNIRQRIIDHGGEVHFGKWITDFEHLEGSIKHLITDDGDRIPVQRVVLATGHSARDIFALLNRKDLNIEAKDFAVGVRIEHRQAHIDRLQYRQSPREEGLPAAAYRLACELNGKGVFSFCMCPGGLIVPAATAPGEIVVNGMSPSRRDSPFANSGMVVGITTSDLDRLGYTGIFAGVQFQQQVETTMFAAAEESMRAPAQRLIDFVEGRQSASLPDSSYIPGLSNVRLDDTLPAFLRTHLKQGLKVLGRKMPGYLTNDAVVVGTESRTSSPVRIPRDTLSLQHPQMANLYPCGEGAGYAGGIVSAAIDGQRVVKAILKKEMR